jgi:hypothetical protein
MTYEKALEELQIIVAQIENEEISIDELTENIVKRNYGKLKQILRINV